jgi:hypothetical protein
MVHRVKLARRAATPSDTSWQAQVEISHIFQRKHHAIGCIAEIAWNLQEVVHYVRSRSQPSLGFLGLS